MVGQRKQVESCTESANGNACRGGPQLTNSTRRWSSRQGRPRSRSRAINKQTSIGSESRSRAVRHTRVGAPPHLQGPGSIASRHRPIIADQVPQPFDLPRWRRTPAHTDLSDFAAEFFISRPNPISSQHPAATAKYNPSPASGSGDPAPAPAFFVCFRDFDQFFVSLQIA